MNGRNIHTREELIKLAKKLLGQPAQRYSICHDGLVDALAELEKPVLPDGTEMLILGALRGSASQDKHHSEVARIIHQALLPKPKNKTVWRVAWAGICSVQFDDFDLAMREAKTHANESTITVTRHEVPA